MKALPRSTLEADPALAFARAALKPARIKPALEKHLGPLEGLSARLMRHKPGKRALILYTVRTPSGVRQLFGKVRAKGADRRTHKLQTALWQTGFSDTSPDGVSVAEPIGVLEPWRMTLQRAVPGTGLEVLLDQPLSQNLASRIVGAAHKLHGSGVAPRRHTLDDELAILERQLGAVAAANACWRGATGAVWERCRRLARTLPQAKPVALHRDFYPEQVRVAGERLYLLDLDLCAHGDPALDIGNFTAHLSEFALRTRGDLNALKGLEDEITERFCTLSGVSSRAVSVYYTLSLARHIAISQRIPERRHLTGTLLEALTR